MKESVPDESRFFQCSWRVLMGEAGDALGKRFAAERAMQSHTDVPSHKRLSAKMSGGRLGRGSETPPRLH